MSNRLQVLVYENRQLKESSEFDGPVELGRQRDRDEGLFARKREDNRWRWVIARRASDHGSLRRATARAANGRSLRRAQGRTAAIRSRISRLTPSSGTRSWVIVSRSRTVTAPSSSDSTSTVTHQGVPISSWRR